jgi:hypothetical protein
MRQQAIHVTFQRLPAELKASPDKDKIYEWARHQTPACLNYINDEGNIDDAVVISHDGHHYVGYGPSPQFTQDFKEWRPFNGCEVIEGKIYFTLGKKVVDVHTLKCLNLESDFSESEYNWL